jgi:hypothetical protein
MARRAPPRAAALFALALATPGEVRAAASTVEPTWPVHVEIALSRKAAGALFQHGIGPSLFAPPNPACSVSVGEQAREAYSAAARRMFRAEKGDRTASLEIEIAQADLDLDLDGWHAQVEHALVLRSTSGAEMGRWTMTGRDRVEGLGEGAIPRAFRGAAEKAAMRFEAAFPDPPAVARWLTDGGATLASVPRARPPPDVPLVQARPPGPPRTLALFVDGAGGSYGRAGALSFRVGALAPWAFVQLMGARRTDLVDRAGFEAGPLFRLAPNVDLRVGGGAHRVTAPSDRLGRSGAQGGAPQSTAATVGSAFTSIGLSLPVTSGTLWFRLGLEARYEFGGSLVVLSDDRTSQYDAARGGSGWAFVGVELGNPG